MKKIAIIQSNYIPWKGYFDAIACVDEFVLYDDMQYTRRDWRNRNQIMTPNGLTWLTVPVKVKGKYHQTIFETEIEGTDWANVHWKTICQSYRKAEHFSSIERILEPIYLAGGFTHLSTLNRKLIEVVCLYLEIYTKITSSADYQLIEGKSERLADLCKQAEGSVYLSGPAAKDYLDESEFTKRGVSVEWLDYSGYPAYPQRSPEFVHAVSILDLLFNCGPDSAKYMKFVSPALAQGD